MLALSDDGLSDPKTTQRVASCCDLTLEAKESNHFHDFSPASNSLSKYLPAVGHCDDHVVRTWLMGLVSLIDLVGDHCKPTLRSHVR